MEALQIEPIEDIATKSDPFKRRCENWYQSHIALLSSYLELVDLLGRPNHIGSSDLLRSPAPITWRVPSE